MARKINACLHGVINACLHGMLDKYEQFSNEDVHMDHVLQTLAPLRQRGDGITEGSVPRNALTEGVARS